jgi:arylsulfatase A-like enzyme
MAGWHAAIRVLSLILVMLAIPRAAGQADERPNVVILLSDDAGYADFGFQPNVREDYRNLTPRIDSIARAGCRLSCACMSGSVCSPSRAGLMTGRYQQRFGHDNNIPPGYMQGGLPLSETLMSQRFQTLGYRTGLIGKWHLGYPPAWHPNRRGFDYFLGCLQGSRGYFPIAEVSPHRVFLENDVPAPETGYSRLVDELTAAARHWESELSQPLWGPNRVEQ